VVQRENAAVNALPAADRPRPFSSAWRHGGAARLQAVHATFETDARIVHRLLRSASLNA
jgi:hypothetical protein